jgi:ankyrin repeat protein
MTLAHPRLHPSPSPSPNQALHWAASGNAEEPIRLLLEHSADPNVRTQWGETALG